MMTVVMIVLTYVYLDYYHGRPRAEAARIMREELNCHGAILGMLCYVYIDVEYVWYILYI